MPARRYLVYPQGGGAVPVPPYNYATDVVSLFRKPRPVFANTEVQTRSFANMGLNAGAPTPVVGEVKTHYGHYALTAANVVNSGNRATILPTLKSEVDLALSGNPNVQGYMMAASLGGVWPTAGTSGIDWTNIDGVRGYIASTYPGKRFAFSFAPTDYSTTNPSNLLPSWVLTGSTSLYGPGYSGNAGYWQLGTSGVSIAWWMDGLRSLVNQFFTALAAHTSPYSSGYTYDTDPYVEDMTFGESSLGLVSLPSNFSSNASFLSQCQSEWITLHTGMVSSFPHTEVLAQDNYWPYGSASSSIATVNAVAAARVALSGPDIFYPATSWTWGQLAYTGLTAGSTNQSAVVPYVAQVQYPDYPGQSGTSMANLFAMATNAVPNGLGAGKIYWMDNWQWLATVVPFINANAIPGANMTCRSAYVAVGGCNTS
jgi:hypothetical protein